MKSCQGHHHKQCIEEAVTSLETLCAARGLRLTPLRRQVFEILWQDHKALTAAEIMERLGNDQPPMTYRALDFLTQHGFVHYIPGLKAYSGCCHPGDHHLGQLLVCRLCHHVEEIAADHMQKEIEKTAKRHHFLPEVTHYEIIGLCASCQNG